LSTIQLADDAEVVDIDIHVFILQFHIFADFRFHLFQAVKFHILGKFSSNSGYSIRVYAVYHKLHSHIQSHSPRECGILGGQFGWLGLDFVSSWSPAFAPTKASREAVVHAISGKSMPVWVNCSLHAEKVNSRDT
jgi:hypothetical protein